MPASQSEYIKAGEGIQSIIQFKGGAIFVQMHCDIPDLNALTSNAAAD
jgi:hypothetical protein